MQLQAATIAVIVQHPNTIQIVQLARTLVERLMIFLLVTGVHLKTVRVDINTS